MSRPSRTKKLTASLATIAVALPLAVLAHSRLRTRQTSVELVDTRDEIGKMMLDRQRDAGGVAAAPLPGDDGPTFWWDPLPESEAALFYPALGRNSQLVYHPQLYMARAPNLDLRVKFEDHPNTYFRMRTNSLGLRNDEEVLAAKPKLRVLMLGDSHMDSLCDNEDSTAGLLQQHLRESDPRTEVLNAAVGSYNLFNYAACLEYFADLDPDVLLCVIYGGNDFAGTMIMDRYFRRADPAKRGPNIARVGKVSPAIRSLLPQELMQELYFQNNPDDFPAALEISKSFCRYVARRCDDLGIVPVIAYLPPPLRGQPSVYSSELEALRTHAAMDFERLDHSDRIADELLEYARSLGIHVIDLRPAIAAEEHELYWRLDHHLNLAGHRVVAAELWRQLDGYRGE